MKFTVEQETQKRVQPAGEKKACIRIIFSPLENWNYIANSVTH